MIIFGANKLPQIGEGLARNPNFKKGVNERKGLISLKDRS
jgi:Sec-independent protein translocase protein TatA